MKFLYKMLAQFGFLTLMACTGPGIGDMARLSRIDPLTTDPAGIRVAVALPQGFDTTPSQVLFTGELSTTPDMATESVQFVLQAASHGPAELGLQQKIDPEHRLLIYRIAPEDIGEFHAFRGKASSPERSGSISISAAPCRTDDKTPDSVPISIYLKTAELSDYVAMFRDKDVLNAPEIEKILGQLPACG